MKEKDELSYSNKRFVEITDYTIDGHKTADFRDKALGTNDLIQQEYYITRLSHTDEIARHIVNDFWVSTNFSNYQDVNPIVNVDDITTEIVEKIYKEFKNCSKYQEHMAFSFMFHAVQYDYYNFISKDISNECEQELISLRKLIQEEVYQKGYFITRLPKVKKIIFLEVTKSHWVTQMVITNSLSILEKFIKL